MNEEIAKLKRDLQELTEEVYRGNFTSQKDFYQDVNCTVRFKTPVVTALPAKARVGELITYNGKLYHCNTANNWQIVGTQS